MRLFPRKRRVKIPIPEWWENQVHNLLPISKFQIKFRTKKSPTDYLNFEDKEYPKFIKDIKSRYWFTTRERKRSFVSFLEIDSQERGFEIIYEKETGKYFYIIQLIWNGFL